MCNLSYIGETSRKLHLRINSHRSDSYKYNPSAKYNKSIVELQHLNLHDFKNTTREFLQIQKNKKRGFF